MVMDVKDRRPRRRRRRRRHRRDRRWDRHVSGARSIAVDWQKEGQRPERAHIKLNVCTSSVWKRKGYYQITQDLYSHQAFRRFVDLN